MKFDDQRKIMVRSQIEARGIHTKKISDVFLKVKRHLFVPIENRHLSYNDSPLSIGKGQTISQPYIVALMMDLIDIQPEDKVLEIGTGSGYQTALLAELASEVYSVERIGILSEEAKRILTEMGYENIFYKIGDGSQGWKKGYPQCNEFNKIIVSAASPEIPRSLLKQLCVGGMLIIPTGNRFYQELLVVEREEKGYVQKNHGGCAFVPLIGKEGWKF